jgi:hypothetical protein
MLTNNAKINIDLEGTNSEFSEFEKELQSCVN